MTPTDRDILLLTSPDFRAWALRHDLQLDAWEAAEKAHIHKAATHLNRSIGQEFRQARIEINAAAPWNLKLSDPDYWAVIKKRSPRAFEVFGTSLFSQLSGREKDGFPIVIDTPYFELKGEQQ